jgi:hypothetical protein
MEILDDHLAQYCYNNLRIFQASCLDARMKAFGGCERVRCLLGSYQFSWEQKCPLLSSWEVFTDAIRHIPQFIHIIYLQALGSDAENLQVTF